MDHPVTAHDGQRLHTVVDALAGQVEGLGRLVLAWFALSLGVAVASPLVKPVAMELVCSSGGAAKLVVKGDDGTAQPAGHLLDCPLCAAVGARRARRRRARAVDRS